MGDVLTSLLQNESIVVSAIVKNLVAPDRSRRHEIPDGGMITQYDEFRHALNVLTQLERRTDAEPCSITNIGFRLTAKAVTDAKRKLTNFMNQVHALACWTLDESKDLTPDQEDHLKNLCKGGVPPSKGWLSCVGCIIFRPLGSSLNATLMSFRQQVGNKGYMLK